LTRDAEQKARGTRGLPGPQREPPGSGQHRLSGGGQRACRYHRWRRQCASHDLWPPLRAWGLMRGDVAGDADAEPGGQADGDSRARGYAPVPLPANAGPAPAAAVRRRLSRPYLHAAPTALAVLIQVQRRTAIAADTHRPG